MASTFTVQSLLTSLETTQDLVERTKIYGDLSKIIGTKEKPTGDKTARKPEWIQQLEPLIRALLTDCTRDITREAMTLLGQVLSMRKSLRHVNVRLLEAAIELFRSTIERHPQKNGVYLAAWALAENLMKTIGDFLRVPRFQAPNISDCLIQALAKCVEADAARMRGLMALWAMPVVTMMFESDGNSRDLQEKAERILRVVMNDMLQPQQLRRPNAAATDSSNGSLAQTAAVQQPQLTRPSMEFQNMLANEAKQHLIGELKRLLDEAGREKLALRVWGVLVLLLGEKLFTDEEIKKKMMSVAERAFNDESNKTVVELMFFAWQALIDAYAVQQTPFDDAVARVRSHKLGTEMQLLVKPWRLFSNTHSDNASRRWHLQHVEQSRVWVASFETFLHLVRRLGSRRLPPLYAAVLAPPLGTL